MKKQVMFTLLAVLTLSILPGCGKSKNEGTVVGGGGVIVGPTLPGGGSNVLSMSNASGRVSGAIYLNTGNVGGYLYTRANSFGDRVDVYIAGGVTPGSSTGYTNVAASATVYLAQSTIDAFYYYCGAQPTVAEFYQNQVTGGSPGNIPETIKLWAQKPNGGGWCYGVI